VLFEAVPIAHDRLVVAQVARTLPNVWFPMLVTSTYLGVALAARDAVIRYALERVPTALGKPIATLPSVQRQIGELDLSLQAAQTFLLHVAEQWQPEKARQHSYYTQVIAAKHLAIETALQVTDKTLRIAWGSQHWQYLAA
jgi:alkylation response protein AidB-like acyl-CoA dehydrogenase